MFRAIYQLHESQFYCCPKLANDDGCGFIRMISIPRALVTPPNSFPHQVGQINPAVNQILLRRQMCPHSKVIKLSNRARTLQRHLERDPSIPHSHSPLPNQALLKSGKESWKRRLQRNRRPLTPILKHGRLARASIAKRGLTSRKPCGHFQLHQAACKNSRCPTVARVMELKKYAQNYDISRLALNLFPE
jgi:hypothetical protein